MSRSTLTLMCLLVAGFAGFLIYSRLGPDSSKTAAPSPLREAPAVTPVQKAASGSSSERQAPPVRATPATTTPRTISVPQPVSPTVTITPAEPASPIVQTETTNAGAKIAAFEQRYRATKDPDERMDVIAEMSEVQSGETVKTLARLFQTETDEELKVDLVDALESVEGFKDEKLAFLALGIKPGQPDEVREAAVDALIDLEDQRAVPILEELLRDPNEDIRESAKDAIEILKAPEVLK